VSEYSALEGDADIDDDPIINEVDEEQDEENAEEEQKKRKPWGDAKHFCPVALKEQGEVLMTCIDGNWMELFNRNTMAWKSRLCSALS